MSTTPDHQLLSTLVQNKILSPDQAKESVTIYQQALRSGKNITLLAVLVQQGYINRELAIQISQQYMQKSSSAIDTGNMFAHYKIVNELGRGGMGIVYKAVDTKLNRVVALKVLLKDDVSEKQLQRFILEAQATANLNHPNIINLYEVGSQPKHYFTMEHIEGKTLSDNIKNSSLTSRQTATIIQKCAQALHVAHKNKIIHRDIKPSNIMMHNGEPKVMDFGLAKEVNHDRGLSREGGMMGTPAYMPPEQANGSKVTAQSDVYSLGATLYHMLTGRHVFEGGTHFLILNQIFNKDPIPPRSLNPDIPKDLEAICLKCLEKKAGKRYGSAKMLASDLQSFLDNRTIRAKPAGIKIHIQKWIIRNKLVSTLGLLVIIAVLTTIVTLYFLLQAAKENEQKLAKSFATEKKAKNKAQSAEKAAKEARVKAEEARVKAQVALKRAKKALYYNYLSSAKNYLRSDAIRQFNDTAIRCAQQIYKTKNVASLKQLWEWRWLLQQAQQEVKTLGLGNQMIRCEVSPDQKWLAVSGRNKKIRLYMLNKNPKIIIEDKNIEIQVDTAEQSRESRLAIAFSQDSRTMATLNDNGKLKIWRLLDQKLLQIFAHSNSGSDCMFTPDGKQILCSYRAPYPKQANNKYKTLILWDIEQGRKVWEVDAHRKKERSDYEYRNKNDTTCCAVHPKYPIVFSGGGNGYIEVRHLKNGRLLYKFQAHTDIITNCELNKDGNLLVTSSDDRTLALWDVKKILQRIKNDPKNHDVAAIKLHVFLGHLESVLNCRFSPDGKWILSCSRDGLLILWNVYNKYKVANPYRKVFGHHDWVSDATFQPDSQVFFSISAAGLVKVWETNHRPLPWTTERQGDEVIYLEFRPKKKQFISLRRRSQYVYFWSTIDGKLIERKPLAKTPTIRYSSFHPNGNLLALVEKSPPALKIHDLQSNRVVVTCDVKNYRYKSERYGKKYNYMYRCAYSPDGKFIAGSGSGRDFYIWDAQVRPGEEDKPRPPLATFIGFPEDKTIKGNKNREPKNMRHLAFSPDGKRIAAVAEDSNFVRIWDATISKREQQPRKPIMVLKYQKNENNVIDFVCCDFSPDGSKIVAASDIGRLHMWNAKTGKYLATFQDHSKEERRSMVTRSFFSHDGTKIIAVGRDKVVKIWEVNVLGKTVKGNLGEYSEITTPLMYLGGHQSYIKSLAVDKKSKTLLFISGGDDETIRMWDYQR